ncbi:hypothetical protein Tco_0481407 [Tanacetum coccineum]
MVSMASQAALAVLGFALINLFRRVEERVRKIQDLTMESAVIYSSVGGVDIEASVTAEIQLLRNETVDVMNRIKFFNQGEGGGGDGCSLFVIMD